MPPRKKGPVPAPVAVPFYPAPAPSEESSPFPSVLAPLASTNGSASPLPNGSIIVGEESTGISSTRTLGGYIPPHIMKQMETEGIDQFELPRAVVTRVAKATLPDNVQVRKEAVLAISKSATIFISYLAAVSDELAKQNARKAVSLSDVLEGLGLMEFPEEFRAEVKTHIKAFRQLEAAKRSAAGNKAAAAGAAAADASTADVGEDEEEDADDDEQDESMRPDQSSDQPPARPAGEKDVDEEDEDTEQRMVDEGAQEGEEGDDDQDEEMGS